MAGAFGIIKFMEFVFLGTYIYLNKKTIDLNKVAVILCIGVVFESILAVLQYINQGSFQGILYFLGERIFNTNTPGVANVSVDGSLILRPYGTFSHPNVLAGYLVIALISSFLFIKNLNKYFISTIVLGAVGIFISFSRTAMAGFVFFILGFFIISIFEKYKKGKLNQFLTKQNLLILALAVFILLLFSLSQFSQRVFNTSFQDESISIRTKLAAQSIKMVSANPVFGVGINNFFDNLSNEFNSPALLQPVHNIYLLALSETGIIGFLFLVIVFIKAAQKSLYNLLIVFVIILLGSFDHYLFTLQQGQILFTLIISLLIAFKLSAKIY